MLFSFEVSFSQSAIDELNRNIDSQNISTRDSQAAAQAQKSEEGGSIKKVLDTARTYVNNRDFHTPSSWATTQRGNVACAYFVSYVLKKAGIISETEYYAPTLVKKLLATGKFEKVKVPPFKTGDIITWWGQGHIGFVTEDGKSIDNSSSAGCPKKRSIDTLGRADAFALRPKY
jgi:hypothetical protein